MSSKTESKKKEPKAAPSANGTKDAAAPTTKASKGSKKAADAPAADTAKPQAESAAAKQSKQKAGGPNGPGRIPMPDKAERDVELEAITAEFNKLKTERDSVQKKIKDLIDSSKGGNEERQKVRQELAKIREEMNAAKAERDVMLSQQKAAVATLEAKQAEERKAKESLGKFTSAEAIDEEVKRIEKHMTSGNFSAKEEKDMIREMEKLKLSKKNIGAFKTKADEVAKAKEAKKEIDVRLNEKKAVMDEISKRFQNVRDALTALEQKDKEGVGAQIPQLRQKHDQLNSQLDELLKKKSAVYEDFKQKMNAFHEALEERKRQEKERREAEQERRRVEQEEREKAEAERRRKLEEEEEKKKPWESEIALCDVLIAYLERLQKAGQSSPATATAANASSAPKRAGTDFGNLKPFVRDDEDAYVVSGKKPAKSAAPKSAPKDKSVALTHTLDILNSFALLGLIPPSNEGAISESISQLKDKRAYFDVLPRAPKNAAPASDASNGGPKSVETAAPEKTTEEKRSGKRGSNANPPSVQDASLFPHLPGSKPTSESGEKKWGPKPTDVAATEEVTDNLE